MDAIQNLINNKADEIFPSDPQSIPQPVIEENSLDLEAYDNPETTQSEPKPETKEEIPAPPSPEEIATPAESTKESPTSIQNTDLDLNKLKTKIYSIKDQLDSVIRLIEGGVENTTVSKNVEPNSEIPPDGGNGRIVEGIFDGEKMIGDDTKEYSVPPNYASKSKLVEGDRMKLTIAENGKFIYKQIKPVERLRKIGILIQEPNSDQWYVQEGDKKYKILTASATFYKGKPGDEVIFMVAKDIPNSWGAVDNIVKKIS